MLKLRIRPQFPAHVLVESPILLAKAGSTYTFSFDADNAPQGPIGPAGADGAAGAGYGGTSTTSLLIANSVTKVFTTQTGLAYQVGNYVRASSQANGANYMEGNVSSYGGGPNLAIDVTAIGGSGTFADWAFSISGIPNASGVSSIATNTGAFTLSKGIKNATNDIQVDTTFFPNYVGGLKLSNDSGTPNTILDIASGSCTDSTNAVFIKLGAFTKSTAGTWTSGTGNNGMGATLTIANSTWYHVFAIINAGTADVYFDTSVTAANKPASTTAFRRIGSFRTDASAHILAFIQTANEFIWAVSVADVSTNSLGTAATLFTLTVPPGVKVLARYRGFMSDAVAAQIMLITSPDETSSAADNVIGNRSVQSIVSNVGTDFHLATITNTSAQIRAVSSNAGNSTTLRVATYGWVDYRGQ